MAVLEQEQLLERLPVERLEQVDALLLLDVEVLPAVRDQRRNVEARRILAVVALEPEGVVVGRGVVALLGVQVGVAGPDPVERRVDRRGVGRRRAAEAEVERQRRVEALVRGPLRVARVADAVRVGVAVPARDRRDRDDPGQAGRVARARGDHVRGGAVVGAADHRDLAVRPLLAREEVHEVDAGLLLLGPAVVPAAARVARADHVGDGARIAAGDVAGAVGILRLGALPQHVVGRVGEDHRRLDRGVARDLDVDQRAVHRGDAVGLGDGLRARGGGNREQGQDGQQEQSAHAHTNAGMRRNWRVRRRRRRP